MSDESMHRDEHGNVYPQKPRAYPLSGPVPGGQIGPDSFVDPHERFGTNRGVVVDPQTGWSTDDRQYTTGLIHILDEGSLTLCGAPPIRGEYAVQLSNAAQGTCRECVQRYEANEDRKQFSKEAFMKERDERMIIDTDRHGPWNKDEQRYEDGCETDRPHDDAPLYQTLKALGKDPNQYRVERVQGASGPLKFVKNGIWYRAVPVTIPASMTQVADFDDSVEEVMDSDILTVSEDGVTLTYNGEDYVRVVGGAPAGLLVSEDGDLLNWKGDNYTRQNDGMGEVASTLRGLLKSHDFNAQIRAAELLMGMAREGMLG